MTLDTQAVALIAYLQRIGTDIYATAEPAEAAPGGAAPDGAAPGGAAPAEGEAGETAEAEAEPATAQQSAPKVQDAQPSVDAVASDSQTANPE